MLYDVLVDIVHQECIHVSSADDSMAILSAFNSEEVEILGLTTIYGNVPTDMATRNAIFLKNRAGRPDVPVYRGSKTSLCGASKERIADFVHGSDGFGNTSQKHAVGDPEHGSAAEFIVRVVDEHPGEVVILALAALTNIALALQLDPSLQLKLNRIIVLGGSITLNGNVNPAAEANIFGDPDAANIVFSRVSKCLLIGLDVTHRCIMTAEDLDNLKGQGKHGTFLHDISQFYLQYHRNSYKMDGIYVHDAAAFTAVVHPEYFEWHAGKVLVVTDGPAKGHTILDRLERSWIGSNAWDEYVTLQVALGVDSIKVVEFVKTRMTR